jgi:hypothetical protein
VTQFRRGQRVRELAAPHREGTVVATIRTGPFAVIWVALDGWHIASFSPSGLEIV